MKTIKLLVLVLFSGIALQVSAQETTIEIPELDAQIENFELPTFSKLSNDIASEYTSVLESLPDLSNIGQYIDLELRRSIIDENNSVFTVRNLVNENSFLDNIIPKRFQLRNSLNNIMFNGFDVNQLHMNNAHKTTGN